MTVTRAWWIDLVVAVALALACLVAGVALAPALGLAIIRAIGVTTLYLTSPADGAFLGLGTAFAIPPLAAWAAGTIDRYRGNPPSWTRLAVYLALAILAIALGLGIDAIGMRALLADDGNRGIPMMLTIDSFELGGTAWRSGIAGALALAGAAAMRGRWPWSRPGGTVSRDVRPS